MSNQHSSPPRHHHHSAAAPGAGYGAAMQSSVRSSVTFESVNTDRSMSPAVSSSTGTTGGISDVSFAIPKLHGNLMRSHVKRDPHRYYDVIKVLGDGSMGSVTMVKRNAHYKGGSARVQFVKEEQREKCCFGWLAFCPLTNSPFQKWEPDHHDKALLKSLESIHEGPTDTASASSTSDHHHQAAGANTAEQKRATFKNRTSSSIINFGAQRDQTYALKSIHMDRVNDVFLKELMNEIAILQSLDHPNIVKAIETFDYSHQVFLVLEHCCGGDLYARDPYDEDQARDIAHSIVDAVAYMHAHEIVHRDLKYENIMFATPNSQAVKIIDFGLGKKYAQNEHQHDAVGTVYTMAPEVLLGDYDNKVDLWSCGVIAFMLLSSSLPFYGKTRQHVVRRIVAGKFAFKGRRWRKLSNEARQFVLELLKVQPEERPSGVAALKLPWLQQDDFTGTPQTTSELLDCVQATVETFATYGRLKKLALLVIAYKSTNEEIGFLRRVFRKFDKSSDGEISLDEFKETLSEYHYTDEELERMFNAIDIDGTGLVHYSEFLAASIEVHGSIDEERIAEAFDLLDNDDSGYITAQNLRVFLGEQLPDEYLNKIIEEADLSNDHQISYQEFLALWDEEANVKKKDALVSVENRRRQGSSLGTISRSSSMSSSGEEGMMMDLSQMSTNSSDLGGGDYFFGMEKVKSVRGVWL